LLVGDGSHSPHSWGLAADFHVPEFGSPLAVCRAIVISKLEWDQLIYEFNWVHLGIVKYRRYRPKIGRRGVL
jgi:hypothetical protein